MGADWADKVQAFRAAMMAALTGAAPSAPAVQAERAAVLALLADVAGPVAEPDPRRLPACRLLDAALAAAPRDTAWQMQLADTAAAVADHLHWRNKYGRDADPALYENFGFCDLIGPDGSQMSESVTLGFVLLGPHTTYPLHQHPARELYLVCSGTAAWAVDHAPFQPQPPGSFLLHSEDQPHAMQTGAETLLAISVWRGAIRQPSRFTDKP